ncbi:hypothetical protein GCM10010253_22780 [Streptomyces badius]|uniref:Holin n=2 Tax=Streptomyces badius TaxID=1941 RepID=A0ABQ2T565_STRBA|nr:hypothetical protein GCM10010253_22780 [Streptomyces badius]
MSGKRTLVKMNAFDLAVTVALGSTLATILLNRQVTVAQGAAALVSLVLLQSPPLGPRSASEAYGAW